MDLPTIEEARRAMRNVKYRIGAGVDRQVFRIPGSRWVYKKDMYDSGAVNRAEYAAYLEHKDKLPKGIGLPEMHMVNRNILAAEYIINEVEDVADPKSECDFGWHHCKNEAKCWVTPYDKRLAKAAIAIDVHGGNVRLYKGVLYIIDLGEYYPH